MTSILGHAKVDGGPSEVTPVEEHGLPVLQRDAIAAGAPDEYDRFGIPVAVEIAHEQLHLLGFQLVAVARDLEHGSPLPFHGDHSKLVTENLEAPVLGVTQAFGGTFGDIFTYAVAAVAAVTLIAASNSAMLGLSRLTYSLARKISE